MPCPGQPSGHLQVRPPQWVLGGPGKLCRFSSHQPCGWAARQHSGAPSRPCCRWKMNGTEMKLEPASRHQLVGGNLVIMSPTKAQDAGVYQCLASNPVGTVVSREAVLRFGCEAPWGARMFWRRAGGGWEECLEKAGACFPWRLSQGGAPAGRMAPEGCLAFTSSSAGILQGGTRPSENPRRLGSDAAL